MKLETERLILREMNTGDYDKLHSVLDGIAGCILGIPIALLTGLSIILICK